MGKDNQGRYIARMPIGVLTLCGCLILVIAIGLFYFYVGRHSSMSTSPEDWAMFGDYLGGVANPWIAFIALAALVVTIQFQQKEFNEVTSAMSNQNEKLDDQLEEARQQRKVADFTSAAQLVLNDLNEVSKQEITIRASGIDRATNKFLYPLSVIATEAKKIDWKSDTKNSMYWYKENFVERKFKLPTSLIDLQYIIQNGGKVLASFPVEYRKDSPVFNYVYRRLKHYSVLVRIAGGEVPSILKSDMNKFR